MDDNQRQKDTKSMTISSEQIMDILEKCYTAATKGLPGSKSCEDLAFEYLQKYPNQEIAIRKLVDTQVLKCSTSGFLTSLGGLVALPATVSANVVSVLYIQLRMIATIAVIGGYNVEDDEVETLTYVCLAGTSIADVCKSAGVQFTNKLTTSILKKLPGNVLTKINQAVGFRFVTKFGTKGIVNLGKLVPVVGGIVGGGLDYIGTKTIARKAYKTFILKDLE